MCSCAGDALYSAGILNIHNRDVYFVSFYCWIFSLIIIIEHTVLVNVVNVQHLGLNKSIGRRLLLVFLWDGALNIVTTENVYYDHGNNYL